MTVAELIAELQKMPPDARVCVRDRTEGDESHYGWDEALDVEKVLAPGAPGNWWDDKQQVMILGTPI